MQELKRQRTSKLRDATPVPQLPWGTVPDSPSLERSLRVTLSWLTARSCRTPQCRRASPAFSPLGEPYARLWAREEGKVLLTPASPRQSWLRERSAGEKEADKQIGVYQSIFQGDFRAQPSPDGFFLKLRTTSEASISPHQRYTSTWQQRY